MHVYSDKFPGLDTLVTTPIEFSKCILRVGNKRNITNIDFSDILSNHIIVAIKMAASAHQEAEISAKNLDLCIRGSELVLEITEASRKLIKFVESRMLKIAPNLSALVGTECAAQLISAAGGVKALALTPSCNIQVMGGKRNADLGLTKKGESRHHGFFAYLPEVRKTPVEFRTKIVKMFANYSAKCVKIDQSKTDLKGTKGAEQREKLLKTFDKRMARPDAQTKKTIVIKEHPMKKRGGKKYRKMKERLALTQTRKHMNRMWVSDGNVKKLKILILTLCIGLDGRHEYRNRFRSINSIKFREVKGR